ncbi:MAG: transglutaminase domain-containing protein [Syntrophales bacterium]|nr:transglutaminase domain-containing protein [Syntrophales bacterium]
MYNVKKQVSFIIPIITLFLLFVGFAFAKEREGKVTFQFDLEVPGEGKIVRLWVPYPVSDTNQDIKDIVITGNFSSSGIYREGVNGNIALYAEWSASTKKGVLTYEFGVKRKEVIRKDFPIKELSFSKEEFQDYLKATNNGPITGKVKEIGEKITKGKETNLDKAKAIYDWIVNNMYRDPNIKGCGLGDVERLLVSLGGKCADISSVFVALSKSVGVPAREIFGIRMPKEEKGDMTKSQHCWAEFYLPGYGWVPVDPSDVRKFMLEKKVKYPMDAKDIVEYYFGVVDESRIAYQTGRDIVLNPPQRGNKLNYFMYPYAEVDGKPFNEDIYGFNIGYKINFVEQ